MAKTIVMHRNKKGQFVKGRASNPKKHHKRKKNYVIAGGAVPLAGNPRHRRRKSNPSIPLPGLGTVEFPIEMVLGVTAGLAGPPIVQGFVTPMMPSTAAQYPTLMMLGSNAAVLAGAYAIGGRSAARNVLVGEVAGFLVKQIQSIAAGAGASLSRSAHAHHAGGRVVQMRGYTGPVPRGMMGYTGPTSRAQLTGGIAQINQRVQGTRFRSRLSS